MTFEIKPAGLPELVRQLASEVSSEPAHDGHAWSGDFGKDAALVHIDGEMSEQVGRLAHVERLLLSRHPAMFYVSDDMCDLTIAAAESLPRFDFSPEDIPTPVGFVYFGRAIPGVDAAGDDRPVQAIAWATLDDKICVFYYASVAAYWTDEFAQEASRYGAPLFQCGSGFIPFGQDLVTDEARASHIFASLWRPVYVFKSACLLMQQERIADVTTVKAGAPPKPRGGRTPKRPEVRVITLRRRADTPAGGQAEREWRHRWIVRGHWRMQPWGPKRSRVRPVWIEPHIKGPEGAPMLGGDKVYHLKH